MTIDNILQMAVTAMLGFNAFTITNVIQDIREMRKMVNDHISDHKAHCKGFDHSMKTA